MPTRYGRYHPVLGAFPAGTLLSNETDASAQPDTTANPVLGFTGSYAGSLGLRGLTSGTAIIVPQDAAGTPTLTLPNQPGTFAVAATSPLALSATTGQLSITGAAGTVLAGASPAFTATPTLGAQGVATGKLNLSGTTSGTVTIQPQDAAGTFNFNLPITAGSSGQVLQSGGGASAPMSWSTATFPSSASVVGTILRADGTNWVATSATYPASTTINQILYSSASNVIAGLATANGGLLNTGATGVPSVTATPTLGVAGTTAGTIAFSGVTSGTTTLASAAAASGTLTLPAATDTLVGKATTDTLTNKTYDTAGVGNVLKINGTQVSAVTGSGSVVLATSPTLVTPVLGVATATSINKVAFTAPGTAATLTLANNSTLTTAASVSLPAVAQGDLWFGSAAATISALAKDTNATRYLSNTGTSNNPAWAQVNLANGVTGNLPVGNLNSGTSASSTTFWRGDGTWSTPAGGGNVTGPGSSVSGNLASFNGTSGQVIQDAGIAYVSTTFTPTVSFATPGTSSFSYAQQSGTYVKIGNLVCVAINLSFTPTIGTGSGNFQIGTLPFAVNATTDAGGVVQFISLRFTWPASTTQVLARAVSGTSIILIEANKTGATSAPFTTANLTDGNSHSIQISMTYTT